MQLLCRAAAANQLAVCEEQVGGVLSARSLIALLRRIPLHFFFCSFLAAFFRCISGG
jgi:hypothetical protein